jgi:Uncharacterised protein family (UPF0175)
MPVEVAIQLPDDVAAKLRHEHRDLSRWSLEKLLCSLYRDGVLGQVEAMRDLGITSRLAFEELLSRHHLQRDWSAAEIDAELATLDRLPA